MSENFVIVLDHPLAQAILTTLRDKNTDQITFRKGLVKLGRIMGIEITKYMDKEKIYVETPLGVKAEGIKIVDMDNVVIVTILRAAMPFVEGLIKIFPMARQGVVSARRVEEIGMQKDYVFPIDIFYVKLPKIKQNDTVIIADPMIATGSTMINVIRNISLETILPKRIFIAGVISTNIAINRIKAELAAKGLLSRSKLFTVSIDPEINDKGYIVPGLGDAGDRAFGHE
ncbi:MAG: uracil phosphoribosyltransferase [Sulfolobaceae archaeon]|nr:uracil phosphoribosyltransferase [Sulfolobaceae archaeon]